MPASNTALPPSPDYFANRDHDEIKDELLAATLPLGWPPRPGQLHFAIREALQQLGFRTTLIERLATHPLWAVRFAQPADNVCRDVGQLSRLLKRALKEVGIATQPGRLTMRLTGRYVIVSFIAEQGEPGELLGGGDQFIPTPVPPPVEVEPELGPEDADGFIGDLGA